MALQESGGARKRKSSKNKSNSSDKENDVLPKKVKDALSSPSEASNRKRGSQAQTVPYETISLISSDEDDETTQISTWSEKVSGTKRLAAHPHQRLPLRNSNAGNTPAKSDRSEDPGRRTGLPKHFSVKTARETTSLNSSDEHEKTQYDKAIPREMLSGTKRFPVQRPRSSLNVGNATNCPPKCFRSDEEPGTSADWRKSYSEEAKEATDKETVNPSPGNKVYVSPYIKLKLLPHLKSKSSKGDDILSEWRLVRCEVLPSATESCPCGHKGIRSKYHIKNWKTGETTFVGSQCILVFNICNSNIKFHKILGEVESTGIAGRLLQSKSQNETNGTTSDREECHEQTHEGDVTVTFEISLSTPIVKEVGLFGDDRSIPIVLPLKGEKPTLTATIKRSLLSTMEPDKKYTICVKFTKCSTSWTAEILKTQPIPPKTNKQINNRNKNN